jgi:L-lysine 2,3-aminomutase
LDLQTLAELACVETSHDSYSRFAFLKELVMIRFDIMTSLAFPMEFSEDRQNPSDWRRELSRSVRDPAELCQLVGLPSAVAEAAKQAAEGFSILVPRPYLARIKPGDPGDPLLLQVLPQLAEIDQSPGFTPDPLGEIATLCGPGLLWKYQNRILILTTQSCAVHCRFCFRRHFLFDPSLKTPTKWGEAFKLLSSEPSIHELILSGGEPLMLTDDRLSETIKMFAQIDHLKRLRIHTRMPVLIPQRITNELIYRLKVIKFTTIIVVHVNHPNEIDPDVANAFRRLIEAGIPVLCQGVLLAGINDKVEILAELYERLANLKVMPYYLHQLDPVAGAAHFEVPIAKGKELMAQLRAKLPGYAVPRYVRETHGGTAKEILA